MFPRKSLNGLHEGVLTPRKSLVDANARWAPPSKLAMHLQRFRSKSVDTQIREEDVNENQPPRDAMIEENSKPAPRLVDADELEAASKAQLLQVQTRLLSWYQAQLGESSQSLITRQTMDFISQLSLLDSRAALAQLADALVAYDKALITSSHQIKEATERLDIAQKQLKLDKEFEKQFDLLNEQVKTSNAANLQQSEKIIFLSTHLEELQAKNTSLSGALALVSEKCRKLEDEKLNSANRIRELEENIVQSIQDVEVFHAKAKRNFLIASEFFALLEELGLADEYESTQVQTEFLKLHILDLRQEVKDYKQKFKNVAKKHVELERANGALVQKYSLDIDRKKFEIEQGRKYITELIALAERVKSEREHALAEAKKESEQRIAHETAMTKAIKVKEDEILRLIDRSNNQLKSQREQYDLERAKHLDQIETLQASKLALQVEVGQLLREKRSVESELSSAHHNFDFGRNKFLQDLLPKSAPPEHV